MRTTPTIDLPLNNWAEVDLGNGKKINGVRRSASVLELQGEPFSSPLLLSNFSLTPLLKQLPSFPSRWLDLALIGGRTQGEKSFSRGSLVIYSSTVSVDAARLDGCLGDFCRLQTPINLEESTVFLGVIEPDVLMKLDIKEVHSKKCRLVIENSMRFVLGSTNCKQNELGNPQDSVLVFQHGVIYHLKLKDNLIFSSVLADFRSGSEESQALQKQAVDPKVTLLPPTSYMFIQKGFSEKDIEGESVLLNSPLHEMWLAWNLPLVPNDPQFIPSKYLLFEPGKALSARVQVRKSPMFSNVRLLLHGRPTLDKESPNDHIGKWLFFIDFDETNDLYISSIVTGKSVNTQYFRKTSFQGEKTFEFWIHLQKDYIIVSTQEEPILVFKDPRVDQITGLNVNRLDTYNVALGLDVLSSDQAPSDLSPFLELHELGSQTFSETLNSTKITYSLGKGRWVKTSPSEITIGLPTLFPSSHRLGSHRHVCILENEANQQVLENMEERRACLVRGAC